MMYVVCFMLYLYVLCLCFTLYVLCCMFSDVFVFQGEVKLALSSQHLLTSESNVLILTVLHVSTVKWPSSGHYFLQRY